MESSHWRSWLALRMVPGVGSVTALALVRAFGDPAAVMRARAQDLVCAGVRRTVARAIREFAGWAEVDEQLRRLDAVRAHLVTWADDSYPDALRHIHDPPLLLFVQGELRPEDRWAVAVVGSRVASDYGRRMTRTISEGLVRCGVPVVSGLARGIDAEAHAATLRAEGRTIAVLGCGIDVYYPREHHRLQMNIARQGAVVSEYPMGTKPDAENFPGRNRIISGMSLATVVVEAAERSGSLITADFALQQGREVFAVPGPVGIRTRGTHRLLRQGAGLAESAEDVLREIAPHILAEQRQPSLPLLEGDDARVFGVLEEPVHVDEIGARCGLAGSAVLESLLRLEIAGVVRALPGKRYVQDAVASGGGDP